MFTVKRLNQKSSFVLLILLAWTFYGLFFASQSYLRQAYFGRDPDLRNYLAVWLTCGYSWAILTQPIFLAARRFPLNRHTWRSALAAHSILSVAFSLLALLIFATFRVIAGEIYSLERFRHLVIDDIHSCILVYLTIAAAYFAYAFAIREPLTNEITEISEKVALHPSEPVSGRGHAYATRFAIRSNGRISFVMAGEIRWISSDGNYVKLHTGSRAFLLRETMKAMECKLDPEHFVRVRRSAIISIDQIAELNPLFGGEFEIVLKDGKTIRSSRRYRKHLDSILNG